MEYVLQNIQVLLKLEGNKILEQHRRKNHEECSDFKPPFMDNNIWHRFPKVDLNRLDGSNLAR